MQPAIDDQYWRQVCSFLTHHAKPSYSILAPNDFLADFPGIYPYQVSHRFPACYFSLIVLHKAMVAEVDLSLAMEVIQQFKPVFANDVFVIYAQTPIAPLTLEDYTHIDALVDRIIHDERRYAPIPASQQVAIVVTTCNRPQHLERSLPQLLTLQVPTIVVDDGSAPEQAQANRAICDRHQVPLLSLPEHRQQPGALNMGITYWLADPAIAWISWFQDEVEVQPDMLEVLARVQDAGDRPLLTGFDAPEHPPLQSTVIAGCTVLLKRSTRGVHLHAHRDYWAAMLPIPTLYSASQQVGRGTDEDWWITAWSPQSITKRGGAVVCVPGLVQSPQPPVDRPVPVVIQFAPEREPVVTPGVESDRPVRPEVSLEGLKVLVDGYNLELTSGTGIKTYGTSLIQALKYLDASVDVLLSRNSSKKNQILDEVLFFDDQNKRQNFVLELINLAKGTLRSSSGPLYRARRRKTLGEYVIKQGKFSDDFLQYAQSFNLPKCYEIANSVYKYLNRRTDIYVSEKIDIWHATYPIPIAIKGARKITTIHDLIPLRLPYATLDDKEIFYSKVKDALAESAVVIAVSEHSKRDLLTYFDVDPDRVVVTYQPTVLEPLAVADEAVDVYLQRFKLQRGHYLLFVGAIEPKKNVGRLLEAYATIDTDMPLVIVGKKAWSWEEEIGKMQYLFDQDASRQVKMLEYVSTESLRYLYRGAYCFLFPSLYEGFGLPPLEAMSFGCPAITSNVSSLPEVCGDGAIYVDPYDVSDIKTGIERILSSPALRQQLALKGRKNAEFFSMEQYVQRLYAAYKKAL